MAQKRIILCDSNVFFDYFRGKPTMLQELSYLGFDRLAISAITIAEVYAGMNKGEVRRTREIINQFSWYDFNTEMSRRFLQLMNGHYERRPGLPDMMIAATALIANVDVFTLNRKDFDFLPGLRLYNPQYQHNQPPA